MKKKNIYIVTDGSYSDYHIIGASATKEGAEALAGQFGGDIEEVEDAAPYYKAGFMKFEIHLTKERELRHCGLATHTFSWRNCGFHGQNGMTPIVWFQTTCWARDAKHAVKIANERLTEVKAHDAWDNGRKCQELFSWAK